MMLKSANLIHIFNCIGMALFSTGCASLFGHGHCQPEQKTYSDADFTVKTLNYIPAHPSDKTLFIFPPTGGTNIIDKSYASKFCKKGYQVYVLDGWTMDQETEIDFEIHQRFYSKAQKALALVLNQSKTKFNGLIGTSVGGLHASISASVQDRLNAVFVITAGTPIAEVVVYSDQKAMKDLKQRRKEKFKTTSDAEQVQRIRQAFHLEPFQLGDRYKNKDLGVSIATQDTVVPAEQQNKLKSLWKPIKEISIPNDHFWGIVRTWLFHSDELVEFFEQSSRAQLLF
jgi:hypothetical protein